MTTNTPSSSCTICDTPVLIDRSMPCESSTIDMNHNNWKKVARKLSFSEETPPHESQCSTSQSMTNDNSNEAHSQNTSDHEHHTASSQIDSQPCVADKQPRRASYAQLRLLKLGNVCQSSRRSRQPVIVLDQETKKHKIRVIDYKSWQWQPIIPVNKLTDDELKDVDCSVLQSNQSVRLPIEPIKFDKDEELIRELSPDTAAERFQKQLEEIKKLSDETSQPKTNGATYKSVKKTKNKPCPELEELDKRIQDMKPSKGKIVARKLYYHEESKIVLNGNIESSAKISTKKSCVQNSQRLGKKMPMRSAKNRDISYID